MREGAHVLARSYLFFHPVTQEYSMAQPRQETQRKAKAGDSAAAKAKQLESLSQGPESQLTTNQGVPIPDNHTR